MNHTRVSESQAVQRTMQRTGWLALAAVCALAGVAVSFGVLRGERAVGERDGGEPAFVTAMRPDPRESIETEPAALAPVAEETRAVTAPPSAENELPPPPADPPARDSLRIQGIVVDSYTKEPVDSPGATVTAQVESRWRNESVLFGRADVGANGRFWFDVATPSRAEHGAEPTVFVAFSGTGYESVAATVALSDFASGVVSVTIEADTGGPLVQGRIVDARSRPVAGATVIVADWGPRGSMVESSDAPKTLADGRFSAEIKRTGSVDVLAYQESVGVAKAGGRLERGERLLDLGDVVLEERGVLAGTVRGLDGTPIAAYTVQVVKDHKNGYGEDYYAMTDSEGRFRFAHLERGPHSIVPPPGTRDRDRPFIVTPDRRDLELRIVHPVATLTVLDGSGRPVDPDSLIVAAAQQRAASAHARRWTYVERMEPGRYSVSFGRPGSYGAVALHEMDGATWYAEGTIVAGTEHGERTLRLERRPLTKVELRVKSADGTDAGHWRVEFLDPKTRRKVAPSIGSSDPIGPVPPGNWLVRVLPRQETMFLAFEKVIDIPQAPRRSPSPLSLSARARGGRLELYVEDSVGGSHSADVEVRRTGQNETRSVLERWPFYRWRALPETLEAGSYTVTARRAGASSGDAETRVEIRPGETSRARLSLR